MVSNVQQTVRKLSGAVHFFVRRRNVADFTLLGKLTVPAITVLIVTGSA
jgi:hypothetical protein